jgi:DNA-binding CsgD family transcriptional regulator
VKRIFSLAVVVHEKFIRSNNTGVWLGYLQERGSDNFPVMQDCRCCRMEPLDLMQSFVERCERSAPESELARAFEDSLAQMGFRYFVCCSHVNPGNPPSRAVVLHNYPAPWMRSYSDRNLHDRDPVLLHAERTILPFFWDTPDFRESLTRPQKQIMREAADAGIDHGYTVPIHTPCAPDSHRASCSVVPDAATISKRAYSAVQVMSVYLYASVHRLNELQVPLDPDLSTGGVLSLRERQCLEFAAQGKGDWEISRLLSISPHTVHKHIEAAKRRLGVFTRVQAIVWAAQRGEISLDDVVKSGPLRKDDASRRIRRMPE